MINLSPRLASIAGELNQGETMADIGTDHGFLPVYLWEKGICPHVIMTDVSDGSLDKAKANCSRLHPDASFDFRLGDGLTVLEAGEVDTVVLAGMGGILMTQILEADMEKTWSLKKLILQPRNNVGRLRHWLYNHCFSVTNEQLVREGKYICEILTAVPKEVAVIRSLGPERVEYQYPRKLLDFKNPLTEEYLLRKKDLELEILQSMIEGGRPEKELRGQRYRVEHLEGLLKELNRP